MFYKQFDEEKFNRVFLEAYEKGKEMTSEGKVASYIPELEKENKNNFGIYIYRNDGKVFKCGDYDKRFTMQSVSKIIALLLALKEYGFTKTFENVLMEPSGDSFNSIIKLDTTSSLPFNPLINAGAIEIVSMLVGKYTFDDILEFTRRICDDKDITLNEDVYKSESITGDRNRAIAFLLKSKNVLKADPYETIDLYFKMCSLNVTAKSLANLGLVLSNGGTNPFTKEEFIGPRYVRTILSLMFTCGMYDGSGEFSVRVGLPAKSGVGGGILTCAEGMMGIGVYGPSLNEKGNSIGGITALKHLSHRLHLHVFDYTVEE